MIHSFGSLILIQSANFAFRCKKMIQDLSRRRLIHKTHENHDIYSVHRLLQHRLLQEMSTNAKETDEFFRLAFHLVRQRLPRPSSDTPEQAKWNAFKEYLPHVLSLQRVYADELTTITPFLELS